MRSLRIDLPVSQRAAIMRAWRIVAAGCAAMVVGEGAVADDKPAPPRDDLDVTMQIIVDPDAKLPDEVVRRIELPRRQVPPTSTTATGQKQPSDAATKGQERAEEARQHGQEMSQSAREKNNEAAEQREQARRSMAEEARDKHPPKDPPGRPTPPTRP